MPVPRRLTGLVGQCRPPLRAGRLLRRSRWGSSPSAGAWTPPGCARAGLRAALHHPGGVRRLRPRPARCTGRCRPSRVERVEQVAARRPRPVHDRPPRRVGRCPRPSRSGRRRAAGRARPTPRWRPASHGPSASARRRRPRHRPRRRLTALPADRRRRGQRRRRATRRPPDRRRSPRTRRTGRAGRHAGGTAATEDPLAAQPAPAGAARHVGAAGQGRPGGAAENRSPRAPQPRPHRRRRGRAGAGPAPRSPSPTARAGDDAAGRPLTEAACHRPEEPGARRSVPGAAAGRRGSGLAGPDVEQPGRRTPLAFLRRRLTGDYDVDEFGFDPDLTDNVLLPLLRLLYRKWFRVEIRGIENVPDDGRRAGRGQPLRHDRARRADDPGRAARRAPRAPAPADARRRPGLPDCRSSATSPARAAPPWPATPTPSGCCPPASWSASGPEGFKGVGKPFASGTSCSGSAAAGSSPPRCAPARRSSRARSSAPRRSTR